MDLEKDIEKSIKKVREKKYLYVAKKAGDIFQSGHKLGIKEEQYRTQRYLRTCAKKLNFGDATPNEAIIILCDAMKEIYNQKSDKLQTKQKEK